MRRFLGTIVTASALAQGCGSGGGTPEPPPAGYAGEFNLHRYVNTIAGAGTETFLYADVRFTAPDNTLLDAGRRVVLTGPGGEIELTRVEVLGRVFYQKDPDGPDIDPSRFVPGAAYTMQVAGSRVDGGVRSFELAPVLTLPEGNFAVQTPDFSSGQVTVDGTADLPITWTAGNGEYVDVLLAVAPDAGGDLVVRTFRVTDDGGFDVAASELAALPVGSGTLTLVRTISAAHVLPDEGSGVGIGADAVATRLVRQ